MVRWTKFNRFLLLSVGLSFFYVLNDLNNENGIQMKLEEVEPQTGGQFHPLKYFPRFRADFRDSKIVLSRNLLHLNEFHFVKNASKRCTNEDVYLLAFVHSAAANFEKRRVIRSSWASKKIAKKLRLKLVFLIGLPENDTLQSLLEKENSQHSDIVQGNFYDTYKNLTLKHLMGYKWVLQFCSHTKFVMKADDDAFIDIFKVIKVLKETFDTTHQAPRDILACSLFPEGTSTKRDGKWRLSTTEYPFDTFPTYCSGVAYFATPDVLFDMYNAASDVKPFVWIDDLFVTGIVASALNIRLQPLNLKFTYNDKDLRNWLRKNDNKPSAYMVADIGYVNDWKYLVLKLWEKTMRVWK
ncbi:beta-1:3-galactosyltransferase 5-like protein [Leptotrombidium deliense]|uniref:Hexosyltransferase n=1 Tax=Leptotrombidium deliense TaxID=299467 RepID=A0A443SS28_9ACAR|nr:beta-1:3-galactosyltransferase 5-like protein [Leptotrombidium deliense]